MGGNLLAIKGHLFKHNDIRGIGYPACIKGERDSHFAFGLIRGKGHFGMDFLAVQLERFARGFVHERTGELVFLAGSQALVRNNVLNGNRPICIHFLFAADAGLRPDPRPGDRHLDRLRRVLYIGVSRQLDPITRQALKGYDLSGIHQPGGIKSELHYSFAVRRFGCKGAFRVDLLAMHFEGFDSVFVHEDAVHIVLLAGGQVLIRYHIVNRNGAINGDFFFLPNGGLGADLRHMDGHGLAFILNIRMDGQLFALMEQAFEHHDIGVGLDIFRVKLKSNNYGTSRRFGSKYSFSLHILAANFQRFAGSLVHESSLNGVRFARYQMGVFHYIFQRKHLGSIYLFFAADGGSSTQLRHLVIDYRDFNNLFIPLHLHMMDIRVGEIPLRRLQFPHDPVAQRNIVKGEHPILARGCGQDCGA